MLNRLKPELIQSIQIGRIILFALHYKFSVYERKDDAILIHAEHRQTETEHHFFWLSADDFNYGGHPEDFEVPYSSLDMYALFGSEVCVLMTDFTPTPIHVGSIISKSLLDWVKA